MVVKGPVDVPPEPKKNELLDQIDEKLMMEKEHRRSKKKWI